MRRWMTTAVMLAACTAVVRADLTISQTTSVQGGPVQMAGIALTPKTTTRIKGMKERSDIEVVGQSFSTIVDLTTKQVAILRHDQKTVQIVTASDSLRPQIQMQDVSASMQPTGRSQVIDGVSCDEYGFTTDIPMASIAGTQTQLPPEAVEMLQGVTMKMKGSVWVAKSIPGADEYAAFMAAASRADLTSLIAGAASGNNSAMARMMDAMAKLKGIAYMTDMTMSFEGTGQFVDMMNQMGGSDMHATTKVSSISTDPIDDSVFTIPADYTVIKR